jgi:hypothetical protein
MRGESKAEAARRRTKAKARDLGVGSETGRRATAVTGGCQNNLQPVAAQGGTRATPAMTRQTSLVQEV